MRHNIFIMIPAYENVTRKTFLTILKLFPLLARNSIGINVCAESHCYLEELRNIMATIFYDVTDCTHMLFVDSDMGFEPELVLDLLSSGYPLCGAMYPQRARPLAWSGNFFMDSDRHERQGDFMKVAGIGMGCALIHRSVITTMLEKMPQLSDQRVKRHIAEELFKGSGIKRIIRAFDPLDMGEQGIARDDIAFCNRWEMCGGETWAHIGQHINHVGQFDYGACYLDEAQKADSMRQAAE